MRNKILSLTSHEFYLVCEDFESSSFDTCISMVHEENVKFVANLMACVKIEIDINQYEYDRIYFNFSLDEKQIELLKCWVDWSYCESYGSYLHDEDKKAFLRLRNKIVSL